MSTPLVRTKLAAAIAGAVVAFAAGQAQGAAFSLQAYCGSALGNAPALAP